MIYVFLADATVALHGLFILFVLFGGALVMKWRGLVWLHIPCVVWGVLSAIMHWVCPLTALENDLRASGGARGYSGGYIEHYLLPLIYPEALTPAIQVVLGLIVLVLNLFMYALVWQRFRRQ